MSHETTALLNDSVLETAARPFDVDCKNLQDLGGNVNFVYACEKDAKPCILRLTHDSRRKLPDFQAEAHFVNYLAENGASVSRVIPARDGSLAVQAENGFSAVLFEKAPGRLLPFQDWTPEFYVAWGEMMGRFHALARTYTPDPQFKRNAWHEEEWLQVDTFIPATETLVLQKAHQLLNDLHRMPTSADSYGLVHNDLHARNFLITDDGKLTAFDFDDCCYNWFAGDIANVLYYAVGRLSRPPGRGAGEREFMQHFLTYFLEGYRTQNEPDDSWWAVMPHFLKLRRVLLYVYYHKELDMANLSPEMAGVVERTRRDIEEDFPITSFCF